jgi:hypothetical protein
MMYALSVQARLVREGTTLSIMHAAWLGRSETRADAEEDARIAAVNIMRQWQAAYALDIYDMTVNVHFEDGTRVHSDFATPASI